MKSRFALGPLLLGSILAIASWRAEAQTFTTLHIFTGSADGESPIASLIMSGNTLYGTAAFGGNYNAGTVFALNTDGSGFKKLFSTGFSGVSGASIFGGLVMAGNTLYGTTAEGGSSSVGTVFAINTDGSGFNKLYDCNFSETAYPRATLLLLGNTLYGTGNGELGKSNDGTVFAINTDGSGYTTLYSFTAFDPVTSTNSDGAFPFTLLASGDTLYGTAYGGGSSGRGTLFQINTDGTGFTVLHAFGTSAHDGAQPLGLLLLGDKLYGTTMSGGEGNSGTLFKVNTDGSGFTTLYRFSVMDFPSYTNSDGAHPVGGLISSGNTLYGTARAGGGSGNGTVFQINIDGTGFKTLHTFSAPNLAISNIGTNGDGAGPQSGLILAGNTLYGTTTLGGSSGKGTVFSLALPGPQLTTIRSGANVILSWPTDATGFVLQSATTLANGGDWQDSSLTPTEANGQKSVTVPPTGLRGFFRLRGP